MTLSSQAVSSGPRFRDAAGEGEAVVSPPVSPPLWEPLFAPGLSEERRQEVLHLLEAARSAAGPERSALAGDLCVQLESLGRGSGGREVADLLLFLLEADRLEGLVEPGGRPCRMVAVDCLTRLGFPYALEVPPEDLERLRAWTRRGRGLAALTPGRLSAVALWAGFVGQWSSLPPEVISQEGSLTPVLVLLMGLSLMGWVMALLAPRPSPSKQAGLFVLAVLSLVELFLGGVAGYHGAVSGLAGLVACLLLVRTGR